MRKIYLLSLILLSACDDPEISKLRKAAENGNAVAQFNLGEEYYQGGKLKQNHTIGIEWYEKSAKQNNLQALEKLAQIYIDNEKHELALSYIGKLCHINEKNQTCKKKQDVEIQKIFYEANSHYKNNEIEELMEKIITFWEDYIYAGKLHGDNLIKYNRIILNYAKLAAEKNNAKALNLLGLFYSKFTVGITENYQLAREYFEKSSELGFETANLHLGNLYRYGTGVEKQPNVAKEYYEQVQNHNKPVAMYMIGQMYFCREIRDDKANNERRISIPNTNNISSFDDIVRENIKNNHYYDHDESMKYLQQSCQMGYNNSCDMINTLKKDHHTIMKFKQKICSF